MSQINATHRTEDSTIGLLMVAALIVILAIFGALSYRNGWFMSRPETISPSSSTNIILPPVISNPTPASLPVISNPTPALDPAASGSFQGSGGTATGDY